MSEEPIPPVEPDPKRKPIPKIFWVMCIFVPSLVGISCLNIKTAPQWLGFFLFSLNAVCSVAAGIGLLSSFKDPASRVFSGIFLGALFFVLNVLIVIFIGCSGMAGGRIAP